MSAAMPQLAPIEAAKRLAAYAAVDRHVKPEHKVGSSRVVGSSARMLNQRCRSSALDLARQFRMLLSGSWLKDRMPTLDASSSQPVSKTLHADLPF
jgi:hypothetical protein